MTNRYSELGLHIFKILPLSLTVIISLSVISNNYSSLPMVLAQPPSEAVKVLVDDAIQALKSNDVKKANDVHLSILNQQLQGIDMSGHLLTYCTGLLVRSSIE